MNGELKIWWAQIRAIVRLEMKKTFFARRGLWVYLLALAPVLLFFAHSFDEMRNRQQRSESAEARAVSTAVLDAIKTGMTTAQVESAAGEPYSRFRFHRRGTDRTTYRYTDGESNYDFFFEDDELTGITKRTRAGLTQDSLIFATVFQFFYLRLAIFFGCVGVFMNLFRGEMIDKSLHFYLLAPVRREVLVAGKYLAGLIATVVIFTTSTALQLWAATLYLDKSVLDEYLHGPGWGHAAAYLGVTALACLGYGSVFLAAGLLFRNPMIPAVAVLLWESANVFLPAALKKISVIFYLQSMCPVVAPPNSEGYGVFSLLLSSAEPTPVAIAVAGLFAVTAVVLVLASLRARKLEINYGTD